MTHRWRVIVLVALASACQRAETAEPRLTYPVAHKGDVVDDYAGTKVADPYRWMESLDSKEVADWVAASNAVTDPYLARLCRCATHFNTRLTELWNYPRVGLPVVKVRDAVLLAQLRPAAAGAGLHAAPGCTLRPRWCSTQT